MMPDIALEAERNQYAVYCSTRSSRKVVHRADCCTVRNIKPENLKSYKSLKKAMTRNYTMCDRCLSVKAQYNPVRQQAIEYGNQNHLRVELGDDAIHIFSKNDLWRIIIDEENAKPVLYHKNTFNRCKLSPGQRIMSFHRQKCGTTDILKMLKYIVKHDRYKEKSASRPPVSVKKDPGYNPPHKKSSRGVHLRRIDKHKEKRRKVARVLALIDELMLVDKSSEEKKCIETA